MPRPHPFEHDRPGRLNRRDFIDRVGRYTLGGVVAGGTFGSLGRIYAEAQQRAVKPPNIPIPAITRLKDNLYVIGGADAEHRATWTGGSTAVFVTEKNGVVLVDTKNPGWGQVIIDLVKSVTDKPVTTIISTHTHIDHIGSNPEFPSNIEFVAHANCLKSLSQEKCLRVTGCQVFAGENRKFLPKKTFTDRMTLFSGKDRVELYWFGNSHTDGDALVVFPALRAMHGGDVYSGRYLPFVDTDNGGSGVGYADVLAKIAKSVKNVDTLIPGHRDNGESWKDLLEYTDFHKEFVANVAAGMKAGKSAEEIANAYKNPPRYAGYGLNTIGAPTRLKINIGVICDELKKRA